MVARPASFDLSDWRLEESRENALAGEWLFFPAQLLEPTNLSQIREAGLSATLPSFFSEEKSGNPRSHGFGTYVTQVRLPDFARTTSMVLSLSPADTAGRFQVTDLDGNPLSPVVHQGRIGVDKESTIPQRVPSQVPLKLGLPENILVWVQIGNFHQEIGGLWGAPVLVEATHAFRGERVRSMIDGVMVGLMMVFAIYHLVLYAQGRRESVLLAFALSCIVAGIRSGVMARYPESLISDWDVIDYSFWLKVEFATMPLSILAFAYYFRSFSGHFLTPRWLWNIILWMGLALVGMILVVPTTMSTSLLWVLQFHMMLGVVWLISRLLSAWADNVQYIQLVLVGGIVLGLTILQDVLHAIDVIDTGHYAHYVFGVFLFLQSLIIARRYSETMDERDDLTHRVLKQATMLAHESDKRASAEVAQREAATALRIQAEAKMTLFGEAVHHINNPLNHILGSLHGLAARQSEVRKLTNDIFDSDEGLSDEALAVKNQYTEHFADAQDFYESAINAIVRATSTVQLLRALSGVDGISYKSIQFGEIWELMESRSLVLTQLIDPDCLVNLMPMRCVGHPAMYAQALELVLGSFVIKGNELGTLRQVGEEEESVIMMRRAGESGEMVETPVCRSNIEVAFDGAVQVNDSSKVVEVVQHLLEPYGTKVSYSQSSFTLSVLSRLL